MGDFICFSFNFIFFPEPISVKPPRYLENITTKPIPDDCMDARYYLTIGEVEQRMERLPRAIQEQFADNTQQPQHKSIFADNNEDKPLQASISKKHASDSNRP
ncbi:MAG: hypothetical protein ACXV8Q_09665 [Methylobacter sp.]